jgi:hypothetical protein
MAEITPTFKVAIKIEIDALSPALAAQRMADYMMADPALLVEVEITPGNTWVYSVDKRDGKATFLRHTEIN